MFTQAEKGYLALTLCFLAAGSGIKAYRHASIRLGPFPDQAFLASQASKAKTDSLHSGALPQTDSAFRLDSTVGDTATGPSLIRSAVNGSSSGVSGRDGRSADAG